MVMKVSVVGTGYVGLVSGACFASTGNEVLCLDLDEGKIARLNRGESPIYEPGLSDLIQRNARAGRLKFTTDKDAAYRHGEAVFICVGTPSGPDGSADLRYVLQAAEDIAAALEQYGREGKPRLVVVKSTVPVGTTHRVRDAIARRTTAPFLIANNPEFLKEGAAIQDFMKPDRVIVGADDPAAGELMRSLHEPFVRQGNPILVMDIRSSEMVKYASNAILAARISFINEIATLCEHYGADVKSVREGMCADQRIGKHFLYPGLGYGGSCFPKDTLAVVGMGRAVGFECRLNQAVHEVNQGQREHFWSKVVAHFGGNLRGRTLAFWGIAFKPETDDIREAPSLTLIERALDAGAQVRAFDPVAVESLKREFPRSADVTTTDTMYAALEGADALIICTEWSDFRQPDFERIARTLKEKTVFDGRNIWQRQKMAELGFSYYAVGRPAVNGRA